MASNNTSTPAVPPTPTINCVEEQEVILQRAENLQNRVASILLTTVENAAERIAETLRHASSKIELGMAIASQQFVDNTLTSILENIDNQRTVIQGRLADKKLSRSQRLVLETRLVMLERQEETALTKMGGVEPGQILLEHKPQE